MPLISLFKFLSSDYEVVATNACDQRELLPQAVTSEPTYKTTRLCIKGVCDLVFPFHVSELDEECQPKTTNVVALAITAINF